MHLEIIRGDKRDMKERGKSFKKLEGRPKGKSKQKDLVDKYRKYNPNETIKGCIEETGLIEAPFIGGEKNKNRWCKNKKRTIMG